MKYFFIPVLLFVLFISAVDAWEFWGPAAVFCMGIGILWAIDDSKTKTQAKE